MFWTFVSPKGGVGVSTIAASVAAALAVDQPVTIVDLGGDLPDIFGLDVGGDAGVWDWLAAGDDVGVEALSNLEVEVRPGLTILPSGSRTEGQQVAAGRCHLLAEGLSAGRLLLGDLGVIDADPFSTASLLAAASDRTTLVVRACYLALRRAQRIPLVVDEVIEVVEGGRALATIDIESVLGQEVTARVAVDPRIARAVDGGLGATRPNRHIRRLLRDVGLTHPQQSSAKFESGR